MSGLSHEARELVRSARNQGLPTPAALDRVQRGLEASLGVSLGVGLGAGAAGTAGTGASGAGAGALKAGWWAATGKFVAAAVVSAGVATAGVGVAMKHARESRAAAAPPAASAPHISRGHSSAGPRRARAEVARREEIPLETQATKETAVPAGITIATTRAAPSLTPPPARQRVIVRRPSNNTVASANTSANASANTASATGPAAAAPARVSEVAGLSAAWTALNARDPSRALQMLEDLAAQYPNGSLAPERGTAHAVALCVLGRRREGRAEAGQLLRSWPRSPYAARLRASCGVEP